MNPFRPRHDWYEQYRYAPKPTTETWHVTSALVSVAALVFAVWRLINTTKGWNANPSPYRCSRPPASRRIRPGEYPSQVSDAVGAINVPIGLSCPNVTARVYAQPGDAAIIIGRLTTPAGLQRRVPPGLRRGPRVR
jgi:hypothetical protein